MDWPLSWLLLPLCGIMVVVDQEAVGVVVKTTVAPTY